MHLFLTILAFLIIFSLLILVHECGHFMAAKRAGVKVEEFGFGLPPRLFGIKRGETIYSLNWIPFGGFVRMLGEDDTSKEAQTSKRSYANQPLRIQAWIVCAGVIMNLLFSFVLLTVGFVTGIEPLIATEDDFLEAVREGTVHVEPGIVVVSAPEQPLGETVSVSQLNSGDRLLGFETLESWQRVTKNLNESLNPVTVKIDCSLRSCDRSLQDIDLQSMDVEEVDFAPLYLPHLVYRDTAESVFHGLLNEGEVILSVESKNGLFSSGEIFTQEDLYKAIDTIREQGDGSLVFQVYDFSLGERSVEVDLGSVHPLVSYVEMGSPADQLGLQAGDEIWSVNGTSVHVSEEVVEQTRAAQDSVNYVVEKSGLSEPINFTIPLREDGRIGVSLADPLPYYGNLSLYPSYTVSTLMNIETVSYGWKSPVVAIQEMWRLGKMTAGMFVNVLHQFVTGSGVPEGVSGPVGIAQMTGITITQGWAAVLRFVALLSLSLGVINILPFPALDGGHFALILVKAISGKKKTYRFERTINLGGFLFLLAFILYITFNDVLNLF